jgi:predicted nucleic acid-binding protein
VITAVDSNVLLAIFSNSPGFADRSARAIRRQLAAGSVVACSMVWAEVATFFPKPDDLLGVMKTIDVGFLVDSPETAVQAARAWKLYKSAGGKRERLLADFIIAAHAQTQCDCLLTRDKGFYKNYFKGLKVIEP